MSQKMFPPRRVVLALTLLLLGATLLIVPSASVVRAETEQPPEQSLEQRRAELMMRDAKYAALRRDAFGRDFDKALTAIEELQRHGEETRAIVQPALRDWLQRDQRLIHAKLAQLGEADAIRSHEQTLVELQAVARANIKILEKGELVQKAREYYTKLDQLWQPLTAYYEANVALIDAIDRRPRLIELWNGYRDQEDASYSAESQAALREQVEAALGMSIRQAIAIRDGGGAGGAGGGGDVSQGLFQHYLQCRRVERYNAGVASMFNPAELENAQLVNHYRERLGIPPLEFDARLTEAARAHSAEMGKLNYFSHESPVEANKTFAMRCRSAGYEQASGENIAKGASSGRANFWMWFDSPGHHQNIAGNHTALGVGQDGTLMTQNFGRGARLMDSDNGHQ